MPLISVRPTEAEKFLVHAANQQGRKKSPVDIDVKLNARVVQQTPLGNVVRSAISGAWTVGKWGLSVSMLQPFFRQDSRASIIGATYDKVCLVADKNFGLVKGVFGTLHTQLKGLNEGAASFIDSFGIQCKKLPYTDKDSWVGQKLLQGYDYIVSWGDALQGDIKNACNAQYEKEGKGMFSNFNLFGSSKDKSTFKMIGPRAINYLGSTIEMANWIIDKVKNYEYQKGSYITGPNITFALIGSIALWSFAERCMAPGPAEQKALDRLGRNFDQMHKTLQDMKQRVMESTSSTQKEELKGLAFDILDNQKRVYDELSALKLPKLTYEKQKELFNAVLEEATNITKAL